ncbi:MAG TPA: PEGA domain-containing protein [Polyangia bacterium]|nr:PEGA domain-containing protein [Polyangia bacterium]
MVRPLSIVVLALSVMGAVLTETAAAAPKDDLLKEAAGFERRGDYAHAVGALEQAFTASGDPLIQYDIGRLYERLKRPVEAFAAFSLFLDKATGAPDIYRQDASKRRQEVRRGLVEIEIRCAVAGARVSLDSRVLGQTPLDGPALALPGKHQLHAEKPGYVDFDATLADGDRSVDVKLAERRLTAPSPVSAPVLAPAPAPAPGPAAVVTTSPAAPVAEPATAAFVTPPSAIEVTAGGVFWTAKEATSSVTPGFTIGGRHTVFDITPGRTQLRVGGKLGFTRISDPSPATFWSLLAGAAVRHQLAARFAVHGGIDAGILLLAGLTPDSKLLAPGSVSEVKSPGLLAFEVRPSAGIEYALSSAWALVLGPQVVWNPRPTQFLTYQSLLRFDVSAGASVRF